MKTKFFILIAAAVFAAGCAGKVLKEAEKHYNNYEFAAAARLYETHLQDHSDKASMLRLADCYRMMNYHTESEKWYARAIDSPEATAEDKLHYADVLRENGKYEEAKKLYSGFLAVHPGDQAASNQLKSCEAPETFTRPDPFYEITEMKFDFPGSCFSPAISGDKLLVTAETSVKPGTVPGNWNGNGFLDLYLVGTTGSDITPLSGNVNSALHEGPATISPMGSVLYFTRSLLLNGKAGKAKDRDNHLELCSADLVNGNWTNIRSMPFNSAEYSCGQPAVSGNGLRLYFISDMPGGFGGTDIYYSDFENGNWSKPVNAGAAINTNGNEMFPTIRQIIPGTDELYFSSDGQTGAGGLDIFYCLLKDGTEPAIKRMPYPFNTSSDDFGLVFSSNSKEGYFASNRESEKGVDRIFRFKRKDPVFFVDLVIVDKETRKPVPLTDVEVHNSKTGTNKTRTGENGHLVFLADSLSSYGFTLRCSNYFCGFSSVTTGGFKGSLSDTTHFTIEIEKIVINKPIRLDNIYYDYNKWNIRPDAATELDKLVKLMNDNPQIRIELSSHTDCRGGDNFNMKLSQKRAQSAVDYIISKGISRDRIYAKGYGESVPQNKCINGVKCTEEEYQLNRRTEFKVVQILTP